MDVEDRIISLTAPDGIIEEFIFIDLVSLDNVNYAILLSEQNTAIGIFRIQDSMDKSRCEYVYVDDVSLQDRIFTAFVTEHKPIFDNLN